MQRKFLKTLATALLMNLAAYGQSVSAPSTAGQPASGQPAAAASVSGQTVSGSSASRPSTSTSSPSAQSLGGKSLGEIARENREKQAAQESSGVKPRVITNKDVPQDPETPAEREAQAAQARMAGNMSNSMANNRGGEYRSSQQNMAQDRAGEQWRRQIEEQRYRIANLQARIDQINTAIRSTGGTVQYDQPHSRYEARAQERVAELQQQLDEQRRRLESIQEAARRAGMHTAVYDP
jgi:predicted RNase H-like nuclease (RuvC/YqgF family)